MKCIKGYEDAECEDCPRLYDDCDGSVEWEEKQEELEEEEKCTQ